MGNPALQVTVHRYTGDGTVAVVEAILQLPVVGAATAGRSEQAPTDIGGAVGDAAIAAEEGGELTEASELECDEEEVKRGDAEEEMGDHSSPALEGLDALAPLHYLCVKP